MPQQTRDPSTPEHTGYDAAPYVDEEEESNTFFTTPSTRAWEDSMPQVARSRVDKVVGGHCLITNMEPDNAVEYAHCLRRSFGSRNDNKKILALEHAWGMKAFTLNLDTRYNIFRLEPRIHKLFDDGLWILLPEDDIINQYHVSRANPPKFPIIKSSSPDNTFNYRFLALSDMKRVPIHRQRGSPNDDESLTAGDFDFFAYPYTNIGTIKSHVHPRFVICSIAVTLSQENTAKYTTENVDCGPQLLKVIQIYNAWTSSLSKTGDATRTFIQKKNPDEEDRDDTSERTGLHRVLRSSKRRHEQRDPGGSPRPRGSGSKRRNVGQQDSEWLDVETLRELDEDLSPKAMKDRKRKLVASWVTVLPSGEDPESTERMWEQAAKKRLVDDVGYGSGQLHLKDAQLDCNAA
ncbi:hypothetical protein M422DRAFT_28448 [Sphaerobolus stellatus SS14]|nr:hypothetical protein M422DRAFT_28448 [Sphaerobolus stellatus SS14]